MFSRFCCHSLRLVVMPLIGLLALLTLAWGVSPSPSPRARVAHVSGQPVNADPPPPITLTKSVSPTTAAPGSTVTYTISYTNATTGTITGISLYDVLPAHISFATGSITGGGSYNATNNTITWGVGALAANQSGQVTFKAVVNADVTNGMTIDNTANIMAPPMITTALSSNKATITISGSAATPTLTLAKSVSPGSAPAGATLTYTLAYANTGTGGATNTTLTDILPANLTYVAGSASGGGSYNTGNRTLTWSLGAIAASTNGQVTFQATIDAAATVGSTISNTGSIASTEVTTPVTSAPATVTVSNKPTLTLSKSASPTSASPGGTVTYTLAYGNTGAGAATNTVITDVLPANITYVTGSASNGGSYNATSRTLTWTPGTVNPNATAQVTFQVTVDNTATVGSTINNTASIASTEVTTPVTSNTASVTVSSTPKPTLTLSKTAAPTSAAPGATVTYTLNYGNTGSAGATNTTLTDVLPANITYVTGSASNSGSYNASTRTLTWALGALVSNANGQVTFQATVNAGATVGSTINNTASIASTEVTTPVVSNTATVTVAASGGHGDWWMFQHDPQHTGRSAFNGPANPVRKWKYQAAKDVTTAPAFAADGTLYVGATDTNGNAMLVAVNPDGTQKWTAPVATEFYGDPAVGSDGTIYCAANYLYAFTPSGTQKWAVSHGGNGASPMIGPDGTIYTGGGSISAVYPNGTVKWTYNNNWGMSSPAIAADGTVYVGCFNNNVYAFNSNGTQKWAFPTGDRVASSPAIGTDGTIYIGSLDNKCYALNPDGTQKWSYTTGGVVQPTPALGSDGTVYFASADDLVYAFTPAGTKKWTFTATNGIINVLIGADGTIYSKGYNLYALNADGTEKWMIPSMNSICPAVLGADGTIYASGYENGKVCLYALGNTPLNLTFTKSAAPTSAAPGATVTYTLAYGNTGSTSLNGVTITDVLPANLTYVTGSASNSGSYNAGIRTLNWSLGTLNAGTNGQVTFQATIDAGATVGSTISNIASIACSEVYATIMSNTAAVTVTAAKRGDWWMFQHDPQHTGRSAYNGPSSPVQKWAYSLGSQYAIAAPAVIAADGTTYVSTYKTDTTDNELLALNPDGTKKWMFKLPTTAFCAPAIGVDGTLYMSAHQLIAINPDGTQKWVNNEPMVNQLSPTIGADGTIYIAGSYKLYAFNPDGTVKWSVSKDGFWVCPALGKDGTLYTVNYLENNLYAYTPDGQQKWVVPIGTNILGSPAVGADGTVYIGCGDKKLYAIDASGQQKWTFTASGEIWVTPALAADGTIYFGTYDGKFYAVDATGNQKWITNYTLGQRDTLLIDANGTIYLGTGANATLVALNPDGTQKWQLPFSTNSTRCPPALASDGTLYIGCYDGNLYAIGSAAPNLTLTKSASPASAVPGAVVTYTLAYANTGVAQATNVLLTDVLPANVSIVSGSISGGGTYNPTTNTVSWTLGTLSAGGSGGGTSSGQVTFQVTVAANATVGSAITNTAAISSTEVPNAVASNPATVNIIASQRGDWWMFHHDLQHTGRSSFSGPSSPTLKWGYATGGNGVCSSAAIGTDGMLYVDSNDGSLYAINPDGSLKWKKSHDTVSSGAHWSSPALATDGTLYIGSADAKLYAYNSQDGSLKWTYPFISPLVASPTVGADGTIYIGADTFCALNPNGTLKWQYSTGTTFSSAALSADGATVYVGSYAGNLYALDTATGSLNWKYSIASTNIDSSPAVGADGSIYFGAEDGSVYALYPSGMLKWKYQTGGTSIWASPALGTNGNVYIGSGDGNLYALSQALGALKWTFPVGAHVGGTIWASPVIDANDTVYIGGDKLYALDPTNGTQKWQLAKNCGYATPAIGADGTIYVGAGDGSFNAIGDNIAPALTLTKSVTPSSAAAGTTMTYTLTFGNTGNGAASNAMITDALPVGITYVQGSATGAVAYNGATRTLTWSIGTVAVNASISVTFQATVDAGTPLGSIDNTATITATGQSAVTSNHAAFTVVDSNSRGDWWMDHHDAQHTGRSNFNGPASPTQKWVFDCGVDIWSHPAMAADGTIYFGNRAKSLAALKPDGTRKWNFNTSNGPVDSSPAVGKDGTIYVAGTDSYFYAVNPDGTLKWKNLMEYGTGSSPSIAADDTVYICAGFSLYAYKPDGTQKWQPHTFANAITWSTDQGPDGTIYVLPTDNRLHAIDPTDGHEKWVSFSGGSFNSPQTIAPDGTIYIGGKSDNKLYALNPADGTMKWSYPTAGTVSYSPGLGADGTIYTGVSGAPMVYAIKPDGTLKWSYDTSSVNVSVSFSPSIGADGTIYIGSNSSNMMALTPDGKMKWTLTTNGNITSPPTIGGDNVMYLASGSKIYAIGTGSASSGFTLSKTVAPSNPAFGGTVTYTLAYKLAGTTDATNTVLTDTLPAGLNYVAGSASNNGFYNASTRTLTWSLNTVTAGANSQVTFQATLDANAPSGSKIDNVAGISATWFSTVLSNAASIYTPGVQPNDAPTIVQLDDQTVLEDAPATTVTLTGITPGDADDAGQTLTITAVSDTPEVLPNPTVQYTSPNTTAQLILQPVPNIYGSAVVTVTVKDNGGTANGGKDTTTMTFNVSVEYVNDAPAIDPIADQTIFSNAGIQTLTLTGLGPGGTGEENWQNLTVTVSSDNPALLSTLMVDYTNPDTTATLTYAPVNGKAGTAHVTITVQDDGGTDFGGVDTTTRTFALVVKNINDAPTLNTIANVTCNENAGLQTVNLTGISAGDDDDAGQAITVTAISDNTAVVPNPNITYTSPNATGMLTFTPVPDKWGTAKITVRVKDDGGTSYGGVDTVERFFYVTVNLVNDAPTIDPIADQLIEADSGLHSLTLTGIGPGGSGEESTQTLTVTAASSNPALIATPTITGSGATRTLSYQPAAGQYGTLTITVTVKDNGGTAYGGVDTTTRSFTVVIAHRQPDLWVRNAAEVSFAGVGVYTADGSGQLRSQTVQTTDIATYYLAVRNDGTINDTFTLKSTGDLTGWTVTYSTVDAQLNITGRITGAMTGSGWSTGVLAPGQVCYLRADVAWAGPATAQKTCTLTITATSTANAAQLDVAKIATSLRRGPDLRIHSSADSGYLGTGIFNLTGDGQTSVVNLTGVSTTYVVRVVNIDTVADTFTLKAVPLAAGWKARYMLQSNGLDITSKINSTTGWTSSSVASQGVVNVLMVINPNGYVKAGSYSIGTVTAISTADSSNQDVVKGKTTRQ